MSRPEHVDREPACCADAIEALMADSTTVDFPTRSQIKELPRPPLTTTLRDEFQLKKKEAMSVFQDVVEACNNTGKKFFDQEFFLGSRACLYPDGSPDDCTVCEPKSIIRVEDFYKGAKLFDGSSNGDVDADDIVQGSLGSCFLIAAICGVANYADKYDRATKQNPNLKPHFTGPQPDPIKRIFVGADINNSVYAVMFYCMGSWEWVIIDGTLAGKEDKSPLYASCGPQEKELWPPLLEKAYAKLMCSVDAIDGGLAHEAVSTLTGGIQKHVSAEKIGFKEFLKLGSNPLNVLSCSVKSEIPPDPNAPVGRSGEAGGPQGLVKGHAYSVLQVREVEGKGFVQVMNPWAGTGRSSGSESTSEWKGAWSDGAPEWDRHPNVKAALGYTNKDDGTFWMSAKDFRRMMDFGVVHFFPDTSQILTMSSVFGGGEETDDVYVIKCDQPAHLRFMVGQCDSRFAPAIGGESEETHKIMKGRAQWSAVSGQLGMRVFQHPQGAPKLSTFLTSPHKKQLAAIVSNGATMFVDQPDAQGGFFSILPIIDSGTPYYVRVVAPAGVAITMYRLSQGVASAVGKTDIPEPEVTEPDPEPGTEETDIFQQEIGGGGDEFSFDASDEAAWMTDFGAAAAAAAGIDLDELDRMMSGGGGGAGFDDNTLRQYFHQFDLDGSGFLDRSECMAAFTHFFPDDSPSLLLTRIQNCDTNGDGKLSFEEFKKIAVEVCGGGEPIYQQQIGGAPEPVYQQQIGGGPEEPIYQQQIGGGPEPVYQQQIGGDDVLEYAPSGGFTGDEEDYV